MTDPNQTPAPDAPLLSPAWAKAIATALLLILGALSGASGLYCYQSCNCDQGQCSCPNCPCCDDQANAKK